MRPEIEAYLRQHGDRYTTEALRRQLITAGYDAAEVEAALRETEVGRGPQLAKTRASRSRFWLLAIGLHIAALALVTIWVFTKSYTYAPFAAVILGLMLLGGLGISGLIGRSFVPRNGLAVALIVPVISAIGLSGICLATISGSSIQVPPRPGVMELRIEPPLSFDQSGAAECYPQEGAFSVYAPDLGSIDTRLVTTQVTSAGNLDAEASPAAGFRTVHLSIGLYPQSETGHEALYGTTDVPLELDAPSDGRSGTLTFEDLSGQQVDDPSSSLAPISGSISWTCDE